MSTDMHNTGHQTGGEPRHETVSFEHRDVQVKTIIWYLISLAIATIIAFGASEYILRGMNKMVAASDAPEMPMRKMMTNEQKMDAMYPPEPRLQGVPGHETDPQTDLREKLKADMQANEQLRWIDQNAGIAQIPVSEAMKLIVEKGVHGAASASVKAAAAPVAPPAKSASASANAGANH
jgi:hypothetical protein